MLLTLHQSVFSRCDAVGPLAPVDVGRVVAPVGDLGHEGMMGREVTDWISRARVTRERQSLATAAAEILKPPRTTGARSLIQSVPQKALKAG